MLAGDIDATWAGYDRFAGWPVPVVVVAGNHEFDGRELDRAWPEFRERCERLGFRLLQREALNLDLPGGRVRLLGATRWSDFDLFGSAGRERAVRAAGYFLRLMNATRGGRPLDAAALREEGLACRAWLEHALAMPAPQGAATVVITHFARELAAIADPLVLWGPTVFARPIKHLEPELDGDDVGVILAAKPDVAHRRPSRAMRFTIV